MVEKSEIIATLDKERRGEIAFSEQEGYDYNSSNVLRTLGYFSLIGASKIHISARRLRNRAQGPDPIQLDKPDLQQGGRRERLHRVPRRVRVLHAPPSVHGRDHTSTRRLFRQPPQGGGDAAVRADLMLKKQEQMYALTAMAVTLGGSGLGGGSNGNTRVMRLLEEGVVGALREKHGDDMSRMAQGVVSAFDELFSFACPKFVTPSGPKEGDEGNYNEEAYRAQLKAFIAEVQSYEKLPALRSYLKLYTSISVQKLASLMETEPDALREQLETMRAKSTLKEWVPGGTSALDGVEVSVSDLEFTVDGDAVTVRDVVPEKRTGEFFLRHIAKQNVLMEDLVPAKPLVYKGSRAAQTATA